MKTKIVSLTLACCLILSGCASSVPNTQRENQPTETLSETKQENNESKSAEQTEATEETQVTPDDSFPPFTGIDISEEGLAVSTVNNKGDSLQILCSYGNTVYFSNPKDGYKLYSYNGESTKRLTDIKAYSLNYYDGCVYFLSSDIDINLYDPIPGNLYKYDTESEETTQLGDVPMCNLLVDEQGIFYTNVIEIGKDINVHQFDPQSGESVQLYRASSVQHIDGYSIANEVKPSGEYLNYFLKKDDEKIRITSDVVALYDCIHDGVYYFWDYLSRNLYSVDLKNGEQTLLCENSGVNYTVFDGYVYLTSGGLLVKLSDGEAEPIIAENKFTLVSHGETTENIYGSYYIENLYSSGDALYAFVSLAGEKETFYMMAELKLSSEGDSVFIEAID